MTHIMTPDAAADMLCPLSRTFADKAPIAGCRGPACMAWRWVDPTTDNPAWKAAMSAEIARTGEKIPFKNAARYVVENKAALGLEPTTGYCGLAGV